MPQAIRFDPFFGWVDITNPDQIPEDARTIRAEDLLRYENLGAAARDAINFFSKNAAVFNLEVNGSYPARPEGSVVAWVGNTNPGTRLGATDYWINLNAPAPLAITDLVTQFNSPTSALTTAAAKGVGSATKLWLSATDFSLSSGSPLLNVHSPSTLNGVPVWRFDQGLLEGVAASVLVPAGWNTGMMTAYYAPLTTGGGVARLVFNCNPLLINTQVNAAALQIEPNLTVSATSGIIGVAGSTSSFPMPGGEPLRVGLARRGDHANDTYAGDLAFIGLLLTRLT